MYNIALHNISMLLISYSNSFLFFVPENLRNFMLYRKHGESMFLKMKIGCKRV